MRGRETSITAYLHSCNKIDFLAIQEVKFTKSFTPRILAYEMFCKPHSTPGHFGLAIAVSARWSPYTSSHPSADPNLMWVIVAQQDLPSVAIFNIYLNHDNDIALASLTSLLLEGTELVHRGMIVLGMGDANTRLFTPAREGRGAVKTTLQFVLQQLHLSPLAPPPDSHTRVQLVSRKGTTTTQKSFIDYIFTPQHISPLLHIESNATFVDNPNARSFYTKDGTVTKVPSDHRLLSCNLPSAVVTHSHSELRYKYSRLENYATKLAYAKAVQTSAAELLSRQPPTHTPETLSQLHIGIMELIASSLQTHVGQRKVSTAPKASKLQHKEARLLSNYTHTSFDNLKHYITSLHLRGKLNACPNKEAKDFWLNINLALSPSKRNPDQLGFDALHAHAQVKFGERLFDLSQPQWMDATNWKFIVESTEDHWQQVEEINTSIQEGEHPDIPYVKSSLVRDTLSSASVNAPGPSRLRGEAIRAASNALTPITQYLVIQCLKIGYVPHDLIKSYIIWLLKQGKEAWLCASYRPITLICVRGKCVETILGSLLKMEIPQSLTGPEQFAGKKGFGTGMASFILRILIETHAFPLFFMFLDLKGAFDHMWNLAVWHSLAAKRIRLSILKCLSNLYTHRPTQTKVEQTLSEIFDILDGTPQGSPNGTDLFCIFIETLVSDLKQLRGRDGVGAHALLVLVITIIFVDDVTIVATTPEALQSMLFVIWKWSLKNKVIFGFGSGKTEGLVMDGLPLSSPLPEHHFVLGDTTISLVETRKILTCVLSRDGKWHAHARHWSSCALGELAKIRNARIIGPYMSPQTSLRVIKTKVFSVLNTDRNVLYPFAYGSGASKWKSLYQNVEHQCALAILQTPEKIHPPLAGIRGELGFWSAEGTCDYLFLKLLFQLNNADPTSMHGEVFQKIREDCRSQSPCAFSKLMKHLYNKYNLEPLALTSQGLWTSHLHGAINKRETILWKEEVAKKPSLTRHKLHSTLEMRPYLQHGVSGRTIITQCRLGILPLQARLNAQNQKHSASCPMCGASMETMPHWILFCPHQGMQEARNIFKAILAHNNLTLPSDEDGQVNFILMFTDKPIAAQRAEATGSLLLQLWALRKRELWTKGIVVPDIE
jgi:hypothetical protein